MTVELAIIGAGPAGMAAAVPLSSHLSCWRRSPSARRQASTWRATNTSQNTASTGKMTASTEPSHAELPAGSSTACRSPPGRMRRSPAVTAPTATA